MKTGTGNFFFFRVLGILRGFFKFSFSFSPFIFVDLLSLACRAGFNPVETREFPRRGEGSKGGGGEAGRQAG